MLSIGLSILPLQIRYGDREALRIAKEIGYDGVYNMELHLERYGVEIMPEFCRFAVIVLRNFLEKKLGESYKEEKI